MKCFLIIASTFLFGVIFISALFGGRLLAQPSRPSRPQVKSESADPDDPKARAEFEWLRMHDPATGQIPRNIRMKELEFSKNVPTRESLARFKQSGREAIQQIQTSAWNPRGPFNVGGRTRALGIDISNASILLAGGVSGGMWRTMDGGSSWVKTTNASDLQSVTCLAQDTRVGRRATWYYGTGEIDGNSAAWPSNPFRGDGIFKSTDNGMSWIQLASTVSGTPQSFDQMFDYVWNIVTDSSNGSQDVVYAATAGGINRSTDGGATWTTVLGGFSNSASYASDVAITSTGVVYATLSQYALDGVSSSASKGIWRSTDVGVSWTNITPTGFPASYVRIVIGICPSNQNNVYFFGETPGSGVLQHRLYKYTYITGNGSGLNGTWVDRTAFIPAFGGLAGDYTSQGSYDMYIKVKPDNENVVFLGGTNLYRSTDGFASSGNTKWIGGYALANNYSLYTNHHPDQHALVFSPSSTSTMFTGDDGGVQQTTNNLANNNPSEPVSWTPLNNGYFTTQFYALAIDHGASANDIVIGGMQDNGTWYTNTTNPSTTWVSEFGGDGAFCAIANGGTSYYVSAQNAIIYRFILDASGSLLNYAEVDPTLGSGYLFVNPFVLDPNVSSIMYLSGGSTLASGSYVWRNSNLTAITLASVNPTSANNPTMVNWTQFTNTSLLNGSVVSAVAVSKTPSNRLYYGRSDGTVWRIDNASTVASNVVPTNVGAGLPSGGYINCVAVDPSNADRVMVVFSSYGVISLFYTSDGGASWASVAGNLEQFPNGTGNGPSCRWGVIMPGVGYFVATSTGLYSTTVLNGSSTVWAQEGAASIGNAVVDMIDTRTTDNLVVIGTHGNGIYSSIVTPLTPSAPTLASPLDGAVDRPTSLTFNWNPPPATSSYRLQVATDTLFTSPIFNDSTITSTSRLVSGLGNSTVYYWRVNAKNAGGTSPFSERRTFTTVIPAPPPPSLVSPSDAAANLSLSVTFVWNSAATASTYRLQIATDSLFTSLAVNDSTVTDTLRPVTSLAYNTKYYWRVNAKNIGGTSQYALKRSFTTALAPPLLISPVNGSTNQQLALIMRCNRVQGATTYQIQVGTDTLFTSPVVNDSALVDSFRQVNSLAASTTYYWRMRGRNSGGSGVWSLILNFSTITGPPTPPSLLSPLDGAPGQPTTFALIWNISPLAGSYEVQVSSDSLFGSFVVVDSTVTNTTKIVGPLTIGTTYFWRVRAKNGLGTSSFSAERRFTVLVYVSASVNILGGWNLLSVPFIVNDYHRSVLFPTSSSSAFAYAGSYVVADSLRRGDGYWLKFDSIQTIEVTGAPRQSDSLPVASGWNMIGSVSSSVATANVSSNPSGILASNYFGFNGAYFIADSIHPFQGYWIKVNQSGKLFLDGLMGQQGQIRWRAMDQTYNTLTLQDASGHAQVLYFGKGLQGMQAEYFEMPPVPPAGSFDARFSSQRLLEIVGQNTESEYPLVISNALYPLTVMWSMHQSDLQAFLSTGSQEIRLEGGGFTRIPLSGSQFRLRLIGTAELPKEVALEQNYPNPFNPLTVIRYDLPRATYVKLTVYNVLGEEVRRLVDGERSAGIHSYTLDASGMADGIYYYKLSADGKSTVRKFVLMK